MNWELHCARSAFARYAADWDRLNSELYQSHPMFDSRFVGPLLDCFGNGGEQLCLYRDGDAVRGALIVRSLGCGRWSLFQPSQSQVSAILLDDAARLIALLETLPGHAWELELHAIDPRYAPDFMALPHIARAHVRTIGVGGGIAFTNYWSHRPKNLKANLRRYINRAKSEGLTPTLTTLNAADEMAAGVARFGKLESAGWKGAAGTAVSPHNAQGRFYAEVLRRFAQAGQATIHELHLADRLAASRLLIGSEGMQIILKTSYDETLSRFAPGRILLHHVIERELAQHPERTIEFYTNATRDQSDWASFACVMHNIQLFRNDVVLSAFAALRAIRRRLRSAAWRKPTDTALTPTVSVFTGLDGAPPPCDISDFVGDTRFEESLDWFELLRRTVYPDDPRVRYYGAQEGNRAVAILPVRLVTRGCIRSVEALSNFYTHLYTPLVATDSAPLALSALIAAATREQRGAHVMRFSPLDPHSYGYAELVCALRTNGWVSLPFFCFVNWFHPAEASWGEYLGGRGRNLRSSIKRRTTRFVAAGGHVEVVDRPEHLDEGIATFQEIYAASWKNPEPYPQFIPSLIRLLATRGMLRLGIARIGERAIAAQLWIVEPGKASIFKVAYHPDFAAFSPGTVLTAHLFRHVIEADRVREIDFLIGDDEYKRIWMSSRRERWGIVAYNPRTAIGLALLGRELGGRALKVLREHARTHLARWRARCAERSALMKATVGKTLCMKVVDRTAVMNWKVLPIARFGDHVDAWDTLVRSRPGTPFLESSFIQPCIDVFASGRELLCLLYINGCLRAAAVMQPTRKRGVWQTFQPSQLPLGAWVSDGSIDVVAACDALISRLPGFALSVGLSQLDSRLETRREDGDRIRYQDYIQTAWVDVAGSFSDYWEARGKNLRQNTRKQHNKLQSEGTGLCMDCVTDPGDVGQAIADYGRLESAGWKAADGTAISPDNAQGRFYRQMLEHFCRLGRGRIYRLRFDDKVVAMDLCIADRQALVILKTAYDESYKSISPSTLLRHDQFAQFFAEQRFARIEFFGKVMEWHTRWTAQCRPVFHVTVYRWAWLRRLHAVVTAPDKRPQPPLSSPPNAPAEVGNAKAVG